MPEYIDIGGQGGATIPEGRSFWNPDPGADKALQNLSNRYSMQAQAMAGTTPAGGGGGAPGAVPGQDAAYDSVKPTGGQPTISGWQGGQYFFPQQESQISRPTRPRSGSYSAGRGRATGGTMAAATGPAIPEPTYQAPAAPTLPGYTAREYAPPEEDPGYERMKRREAMGAGQRELRQRTQEAIVGARSLANPAARKDFVRSTLAGMGAGLEKVARGAGAEATRAAAAKRAETLRTYEANYRAKSTQDKVNYENKINQILTDYKNKVWGAQQQYGVQRAAYLGQPQANVAAGAGSTAGTGAIPSFQNMTAIQKKRVAAGLPLYSSKSLSGSGGPTFQYR